MKRTIEILQEQGRCVCGSEDIQYGDTELDGGSIGYKFHCSECGKNGTEWYDTQFSELVMEE